MQHTGLKIENQTIYQIKNFSPRLKDFRAKVYKFVIYYLELRDLSQKMLKRLRSTQMTQLKNFLLLIVSIMSAISSRFAFKTSQIKIENNI